MAKKIGKKSKSAMAALDDQGVEIGRFVKTSQSWSAGEVASVLIGWMGTNRARQMNDFLEKGKKI